MITMISRFVVVALKDIMANKARSFLTILGIMIGISSVTMMVSIGGSAQLYINNSITSRLGKNLVIVQPGGDDGGGGVSFSFSSILASLTDEDYETLKEDLPEDEYNDISRRKLSALPVSYTNVEEDGLIFVVDPPFYRILNVEMIEGKFFREGISGKKDVVIGQSLAKKLFKLQSPIGKKISVDGSEFTVIGVVKDISDSGFGSQAYEVYMETQSYRNNFDSSDDVNAILVTIDDKADVDKFQEKMETVLRKSRGLTPTEDNDFSITAQSDIVETTDDILGIVTLFITIIAAISLVVGGVGVMNIMLVSVKERVKEIGLRKAIGATNQDIQTQILIESVLFSMIGGIFGIIIGSLGAVGIEKVGGLPTYVDTGAIFASLGVSSFVGIVFGLYPAKQAGKLSPMEALRSY